MSTFSETITISTPREAVWQALADIRAIHTWNPGVLDSRQTSEGDVAIGSTRHCELPGHRFLDEEVVEWAPQSALTMRVTRSNLPFSTADIGFTLEAQEGGTSVVVSPTYSLKYGVLGNLMDVLFVRAAYRKGMRGLLEGLMEYVGG